MRDRYYLNVAGIGFDARVAGTAQRVPPPLRIGALPYVQAVLWALAPNRADPLRIELDHRTFERRCLLVAVANGRYYGGGMQICPAANREDGLLDVCIVGPASRRQVLALLPKVFSGGHVSHPLVELGRARTVRVSGVSSVEIELDGELAGHVPAEFRVVPAALRLCIP